ncbi:MAG: hypothetical protein JW994_06665 [Candidatus Omnitrophica bacterium]|nr:hypothetical protein [Candidatus Omnitrophota bacterium]
MRPSAHIIVSFSLGTVFGFLTKSVYAGLLCLVSGNLPDLDHVIEYIIHHGVRNFTVKNMLEACEQTTQRKGDLRFNKLYLVFHSCELAIFLCVAAVYTKNVYIAAAAIGYSSHIILDYIGNDVTPLSYFMLWRATVGFDTGRLINDGKS